MEVYSFFGLKRDPFAMVPDPEIFYESKPHSHALKKVFFCLENNRGAIGITGQIGTGKSILLRKILLSLHNNGRHDPLLILCAHSDFDRVWLLNKISNFYGESADKNKIAHLLSQNFIKVYEEHGQKTVLLIDEANKIGNFEILEDFRNFLSLETMDEKIFNLVLVGTPELKENLKKYDSFYQRIGTWANLGHLSEDEIEKYINFRLQASGATGEIFTPPAVTEIVNHSKGIPRWVNVLCDSALLEAYLANEKKVDKNLIDKVIEDRGLK